MVVPVSAREVRRQGLVGAGADRVLPVLHMYVINAAECTPTGAEAKMTVGIGRAAAIDQADVAQHRQGGHAKQQAGIEVHDARRPDKSYAAD
ncbi:hypothetical protein MA20_04035 [Bradyrhizobium japonicum]|uniref:Uncharacterized protein n=1 Tax=Bradyrhizobium japonicum TaxID=375 RepID=A0A0A3Y1V1_BRAJP|nr:hypothetical protein MA20_04035 [Bradyrhizobium japonicum]